MKNIILFPLRLYQWCVSPFLGCACRFTPTCSHYAAEALSRYGVMRGGWLTLKRLLRCQPFGGEGFDPVPHFTKMMDDTMIDDTYPPSSYHPSSYHRSS